MESCVDLLRVGTLRGAGFVETAVFLTFSSQFRVWVRGERAIHSSWTETICIFLIFQVSRWFPGLLIFV